MSLVIRARRLVKSFRGMQAVAGIDLAVAPGERVALLGPNGAGKTTTLLMLLGIITPDEGSVELLGHSLPARAQQGDGARWLRRRLSPTAVTHDRCTKCSRCSPISTA